MAPQRRRRYLWLVAAIVLLGVSAYLMSTGDEERQEQVAKVEFPTHLRTEEVERMRKRRTGKAQPQPENEGEEARPVVLRDPVLQAIPRGRDQTAVVVEANAIRNSPLGEMLIECLQADGDDKLGRFTKETGVDVLQDLDRVVMWKDNLVLSGHFGNAQWNKLAENSDLEQYGEKTRIYTPRLGAGEQGNVPSFGAYNNELIVVGDDPAAVKAVIDRMEGRTNETEPPLIDESQTYGEIYGRISAEDIARMLPAEEQELANKLRESAREIELHVDTQNDVAISANVMGPNGEQVTDLGKSLGGALSLLRLKAKAEGENAVSELLDHARVAPRGDSFTLEMALPIDMLKKQLAVCKERRPKGASAQTEAQVQAPAP